ncbi:MAG: class I SAM-dependent methyltransferase [Gemmatimonadaceae bacterium]
MREGTPSRTALRVALRRAAHQLLDHPLVLDDPVALRVIGGKRAEALRRDPAGFEKSKLDPYFRASMAVRSRFAEDVLGQAVARGVRQYVLLGAGLDTFAYRNPHPELRVFEVDHPDTQAWKRWRLAQGGVEIPESVTYAPVDFEAQTLSDGLAAVGFDATAPAQFAMLGVVPYLTVESLESTWRFVAGSASGRGIVFDYSPPPASMSWGQRAVYAVMARRVAAVGEPWKTFFMPNDLQRRLTALGFSTFEDLDGDAINARYFAERADGLRVGGAGRLMHAST